MHRNNERPLTTLEWLLMTQSGHSRPASLVRYATPLLNATGEWNGKENSFPVPRKEGDRFLE
jgi:hypothetical protein